MNKKKISLRISILSIYVITFVLLMSLLIFLESWILNKVIAFSADNLLKNSSTLVLHALKGKGISPEALANFSKDLLEQNVVNKDQMLAYSLLSARYTTKVPLKTAFRIISWVEANGDSISTDLEPDGTYSTTIFKPFEKPALGRKFYRNHAQTIIKSLSIPPLDLRENPFWSIAINSGQFTWTDVFLSFPERDRTVSAVIPVYNKTSQLWGVFAINVAMDEVSNLLQSLKIGKNGFAFLINRKDELIAFPGMDKVMRQQKGMGSSIPLGAIKKPWVEAAFSQFKKLNKTFFTFIYNNNRYIATFPSLLKEIPSVGKNDWKLGIVVPEKDFTGDLERDRAIMISLGILIVFVGIVIASIFSKLVTTRIKMLVEETKRIKKFHFSGKKVESIIKEVYLLSNAIYSMKNNLRSFKKYLPANLVQQLIQSGQDVHLGGDVRILSILFSDIKNFTQISETMHPDDLMIDLSEYLDNLSSIISSKRGTIDKFIGDSIMAFWNAPLADSNHCKHACLAALKCRNKINQLNDERISQGKMPFITRFGLHTGEVIVGNVGSTKRMNYTAIGDSINLTSRLEHLNKTYGTSILVSEKVIEAVKGSFVFRKVDVTAIRGKTGGHIIYELMSETIADLSFDLNAYERLFEQGFFAYQDQVWDKAIAAFEKALALYPEDGVTKVFILRCKEFKKNPPPKDWDGVWKEF